MPGIHPSQSAEHALGENPALRACLVKSLIRDRLRVVVAGATVEADDDESLATEEILQALTRFRDLDVEHLPLGGSRAASRARAPLHRMSSAWKAMFHLARIRAKGPIGVVLYPTPAACPAKLLRDILLLPACLAFSRGVIIHFHSEGVVDVLSQANALVRGVLCRLYRACAAIVVTEHGLREPEWLGMQGAEVIYNGVRDKLRPEELKHRTSQEKPSLLYSGKLMPEMGTVALLHAFSRVVQEHPHAELTLLGLPAHPYSQEALEQDIERLGLSGYVRWVGAAMGAERRAIFGAAHLFVYPSVSPEESCSRNLLEAMSSRLPIVTTYWRGIPEIVGEDAWFADPKAGLNESLYNILISAIQGRHEWFRQGHAFRRRFLEKFTHEAWAHALRKAILENHQR